MDVMNKARLKNISEAAGIARAEQLGNSAMQPRQPNLTEQLEIRLEYHEAEAAKLKEAIEAVKKNPELERVLNLLQRL